MYYPELEEAGLYFRPDDAGEVVTSPGKIRSIAANVQGNSGVPFMDLRRKQIMRAGIARLEETVATALLRNTDGCVSGVFCLNYITGKHAVVLARAVIMATGYSDRLHARPTGTREMSADGIALAWSAGASLVNMEMQWWHTNDFADPPSWQRMQIYPNPMLGSEKSVRMVNSAGEEFFNQQQDDPLAFGLPWEDIARMRHELLPDMRISNQTSSANYEWLDAIDVVNMVDACELIILSSLERQESRGPFFRQDFPLTDNNTWLVANVLRKSGNDIRFEMPYELPFFKPSFSVKDNFEVAW